MRGLARPITGWARTPRRSEAYNQAIAIDPTDPNGFAGRGDVLAAQRLFDQAIADYSEAIRLDPSHSRAFAGRGIVFSAWAATSRRWPTWTARSHSIPNSPRRTVTGCRPLAPGQNELALADYDAVIPLCPRTPVRTRTGAASWSGSAVSTSAIKDLDEAIRLDPKRATAYQNRAAAYNGLGQYERAIDDLSEAIRLDPDNAGAFTNRGLAHFAIGEYDEAVVDLSQAIQLEPRTAITHFNRAEVFDRSGDARPRTPGLQRSDPARAAARRGLCRHRPDPIPARPSRRGDPRFRHGVAAGPQGGQRLSRSGQCAARER